MRSVYIRSVGLLVILLGAVRAQPAGADVGHCTSAATAAATVSAPCARMPTASAKSSKVQASKRNGVKLVALTERDLPVLPPLTEEEAHRALERELSLKVGKHMREADYPDEAQRWHWSGTAMVEVLVAGDGLVQGVSLSRSSGFRVLDQQALEVVRRVPRLYVPAQLRGRPQRAVVPIGFHFKEL